MADWILIWSPQLLKRHVFCLQTCSKMPLDNLWWDNCLYC